MRQSCNYLMQSLALQVLVLTNVSVRNAKDGITVSIRIQLVFNLTINDCIL
jgi:hypothetical protein